LVVDRERALAAARFDARLLEGSVDGGNFLSHAVLERRVVAIRWVYGPHGGRDRDLGSVAFSTDVPQRLLQPLRASWTPLEFRSSAYAEALGPLSVGEELDLDFDFFASRAAPRDSVHSAIEDFFRLDWKVRPEQIHLALSPAYCHDTGAAVEHFVARLRERFGAELVRLPTPPRAKHPGPIERFGYRVDRLLRALRMGQ
jgi:hypothetical protein